MKILDGAETREAEMFFTQAAEIAQQATCTNAKHGAIIVRDGVIIGRGFNSPPANNEERRTCNDRYTLPQKFKFDRTCCVHAEWRAVMDAIRHHHDDIRGSRLYLARLDKRGDIVHAGEPFCTVCSRLVLDAGVSEFVLWHEQGIGVYDTKEFDKLSYEFRSQKI